MLFSKMNIWFVKTNTALTRKVAIGRLPLKSLNQSEVYSFPGHLFGKTGHLRTLGSGPVGSPAAERTCVTGESGTGTSYRRRHSPPAILILQDRQPVTRDLGILTSKHIDYLSSYISLTLTGADKGNLGFTHFIVSSTGLVAPALCTVIDEVRCNLLAFYLQSGEKDKLKEKMFLWR